MAYAHTLSRANTFAAFASPFACARRRARCVVFRGIGKNFKLFTDSGNRHAFCICSICWIGYGYCWELGQLPRRPVLDLACPEPVEGAHLKRMFKPASVPTFRVKVTMFTQDGGPSVTLVTLSGVLNRRSDGEGDQHLQRAGANIRVGTTYTKNNIGTKPTFQALKRTGKNCPGNRWGLICGGRAGRWGV